MTLEHTIELLDRLVAFESVSGRSNLDILGFVAAYLERHGIEARLLPDGSGEQANLFATVGPATDGGVALSGHTDVVPAEGQPWTLPPFQVTRQDSRLYGRGTADMKGFLACCLAMVPRWQALPLVRPIHLAFTHDEEPGSLGAPALGAFMAGLPFAIEAVVIGEPTDMMLVAGHKGGVELTTTVTGAACHSSDPRKGVSALAYAARFVAAIEALADRLEAAPVAGSPFDPPFSTLNVGTLVAGTARNVVAGEATFDWELRLHPGDDPDPHLAQLDGVRAELERKMRARDPAAAIRTRIAATYPGLAVDAASPAIALAKELTGANALAVVPFGTDAGCFQAAGLPTVVLGPGSIDQAHKPDEFVDAADLERCLALLERLGERQARALTGP